MNQEISLKDQEEPKESIQEKLDRTELKVKHLNEAVFSLCDQVRSIKEVKNISDSNQEQDGLEDVRQLLNYSAKQLEKFQLTSAEISMTIDDVKYEVRVTK